MFIKWINRRCYSFSYGKEWQSVVGLEIHAQIASRTKLFSGAENAFASPTNNNVSLFDCATPGTLPVLNKECVRAAVRTALALNCRINPVSMFDRKHYFYADLPAGYQITQQRSPIANAGYVDFHVVLPEKKRIQYARKSRITQIQLEQDSGKSLHDSDRSLVDLNRAGAPLMELVFEPDLSNGEEAAALVKELTIILQRLKTCSCKMEEGALRVDANVSVNRLNEPLGIRTEIKNIGSIRGVAGAVKYEIERQINLLESGGRVVNETRSWCAQSKQTVAMRDKEETQDYRYMPEPNLPPLFLKTSSLATVGEIDVEEELSTLPEMPESVRKRLHLEQGLTAEQAIILVDDPTLFDLFTSCLGETKYQPKKLANILINDYLATLHSQSFPEHLSSKHISETANLLQDGIINKNALKTIFSHLITHPESTVEQIVIDQKLTQIVNEDVIRMICLKVLDENPKLVAKFKGGNVKVFKALQGALFKSKDNINMSLGTDILKSLLNKSNL